MKVDVNCCPGCSVQFRLTFSSSLSIDNYVYVCRVEIRWSVEISREPEKYEWPEIMTYIPSFHKCKWPKDWLDRELITNGDQRWRRKEEDAESIHYVWTPKEVEWAEKRYARNFQVNNQNSWPHLIFKWKNRISPCLIN